MEAARADRRARRDQYVEIAFRGGDLFDDPLLAVAKQVFEPLLQHVDKT
jgi:hypothetical protein